MKAKPDLSFWKLWNISFGFFGVQIAYALQSANISRIFATLGADPHSLSYFWILTERQDLVSVRTSNPVFVYWRYRGSTRHVPASKRRIVWFDSKRCDGFRIGGSYVSRHKHQYGNAAIQNAGRRHG